ncbi:uncharacterized protein PGTG_16536 [Puccinia graminis f. sp. tritici CRL 75-36-700-3]|uniref:No apical meristem-associated C-terminal domain-containing protein n=1 Tax=Puccinia graminis f. sp. tritici (strain CRL 75-36-700-3 / race SCCL) TaxID=418459 RepID=E3L133_PUCGT|nr:uncharacterized protein PGTG_16536 [Puccinia graminis f. sp. tritici CRL 75-36-700-3]EFP90258.2 hypothetical protein PGTG_16536 [Puccinia graminis f. sp. tritici CRL 75-36-700-3]
MADGEIQIVPTGKETTKKKRAPNWLPIEEEQLAISWVHVIEQPEFANNQTRTMFYRKIEENFNMYSKIHYRNHEQIKIRWTSLNTATLKFTAIYNAIEWNPPSGSSPDDWMSTAMTVYANQTKGTAFSSVSAWQKVCYCPKWRGDRPDLTVPIPLSDNIEIESGNITNIGAATPSGPCTPSSRNASSISRPTGQKAAKRRRIEGYKDDEMLSAADNFAEISKEQLAVLSEGNTIEIERNKISNEMLKIEEKKLALKEKDSKILEAHKQSETQMIDYKLLRELTDGKEDTEAEQVLQMMKKNYSQVALHILRLMYPKY